MSHLLTRRCCLALAAAALATPARAAPRRIKWRDLIPEGVAYGEIIAAGEQDIAKDIWIPEFDANGLALNLELDGAEIALAGYVIPLEFDGLGVTQFVLVPFVGACIHVPPPPPNQLVFVETADPWPQGNLWDAVVVSGQLTATPLRTDVAQVGYHLTASGIEAFRR
jgi:hypothetical protein